MIDDCEQCRQLRREVERLRSIILRAAVEIISDLEHPRGRVGFAGVMVDGSGCDGPP